MTSRFPLVALAAAVLIAAPAIAQLPNYDAVADAPRVEAATAKRAALVATAPVRVQWDDRFGVPTFVWPSAKSGAVTTMALPATGGDATAAARSFATEYAPLYGASDADINDAYVANVHDTGTGAIVVKLRQKIDGIDVFRDELNVVLDRDRKLVALSGRISAVPHPGRIAAMSVTASPFLLTAPFALQAAADDSGSTNDIAGFRFLGNAAGGYALYDDGSSQPLRVKRVYFHLPDHFEPAYYLERYVSAADGSSTLYGYVISALDAHVLFRNAMTADDAAPLAYTYRVWATPSGDHLPLAGPQGYDGTPSPTSTLDGYQPTFIAPSLIALSSGPISTHDPWLANDAIDTNGNNADAYVDLAAPDGYSAGDFRASMSGPLMLDRTYDIGKMPASSKDQQMAAITQLFYDVNFLHDWYYDAGFNEAAGNAQNDNYGRGGLGTDSIRAEAQDYSGRNNANMSTPSDGGRPRMQMYLWDGSGNRNLRIDAPSSLSKAYVSGGAVFGPQAFDVQGEVVAANPIDACSALTNTVTGKILYIDRGGVNCTFVQKTQNAKNAGAIAVIIGNVATSVTPEQTVTMGCALTPCSAAEVALLPAFNIAFADANAFKSATGILVTMHREANVDRDGTIDNQIVAHEWMHYMSNRLVSDANGIVNQQALGMGEGWSDFNAMLLTVRPDDTRFESNATFGGAYAMAVYVMTGGANGPLLNYGTYYGIRRVPYSTDLTKDPLTLKHVMNGIPITGASVRAGADGANNSEVHNTGEVWTTMLWEAYAALLRDTLGTSPRMTFAQAQQRMKEYLVASLKITPASPTFLEARDAVLAAAFARDKTDYQEFWQAFAKRGAGVQAIAPERYSATNAGATEDFSGSGGMTVTNVAIDDSVTSCLRDGLLDGGETGTIRLTLKNIGGVALQSTTVKVASSDASLSFANGGTVTVPASNPGDTVVVTVNATLAAATAVVQPDIAITISDPQIAATDGTKSTYLARLNVYDQPKDSATDNVEATTTAWSTTGTGAQWTRLEATPRDHRWFAPEPWNASDIALVSPSMMVAPTGNFSFAFRHRYAFDYVVNGIAFALDGGVIELSTDDGHTWTDIGSKIDKSTNGYGTTPIYANNGNAIQGRLAFISTSPGFNADLPSKSPFTTTTVNLGTDYAGKRVRIRFRSVTASDHSTAPRTGWEIDDIAFTNVLNLPFATIAVDRGGCGVTTTGTSVLASATAINAGQPVTFTASVPAAPSGTVDFLDNGAILGTVRIDGGVAKLAVASLPAGTHAITATFNGSKYYAASTGTVSVQVNGGRRRTVGK